MKSDSPPGINMAELEQDYRVWWAYLLYSEPFREYIRVTFHDRRPLADLSRPAMRASHYHDPWTWALLPDLFERYPTMEDFPRIWNRVVTLTRIWRRGISHEARHFDHRLHDILQRVQSGNLSVTDAHAEICSQETIHIPPRQPKAVTLRQIERALPDDAEPRLDGTLRSIRFHLPTHLGHSATRRGALETLQKNLTWYALTLGLQTNEDWSDLYDGCHVRYWQPCATEWTYDPLFSGPISLTGTQQERAIASRWSERHPMERLFQPPAEKQQRKRTPAARQRQRDIAAFRKWALTCASEARTTLSHVSNGWFPRPPQKKITG